MRMHVTYDKNKPNEKTLKSKNYFQLGKHHEYDVGLKELLRVCELYSSIDIVDWGIYAKPEFKNFRRRMKRICEGCEI